MTSDQPPYGSPPSAAHRRETAGAALNPEALRRPEEHAHASKRDTGKHAASEAFPVEVWSEFRPYAKCLLVDFLISALLYVLQEGFEKLMRFAPLDGWPGVFIANLHAAGSVMAFALFIGLFLSDVIRIHRKATR